MWHRRFNQVDDLSTVLDDMKRTLIITGEAARKAACREVLSAPEGYAITIGQRTRSTEQNAAMWAALSDISEQVDWYGQQLTPEEWKDVFSAALRKQKVIPGLDGGFVVCGQRTSKMTRGEFADLITLIHAFGAERGVVFSASEAA